MSESEEPQGGRSRSGSSSTTEVEEAPKKKEETAEDLLREDLGDLKIRKAKGSKNITNGIVNVLATFNNTKVTFCDQKGNVISWSSAGKMGFRGSRKSTAYAAQVVTQDAGKSSFTRPQRSRSQGQGPRYGDATLQCVQFSLLDSPSLRSSTSLPVPHNGCRPPKRRRV